MKGEQELFLVTLLQYALRKSHDHFHNWSDSFNASESLFLMPLAKYPAKPFINQDI